MEKEISDLIANVISYGVKNARDFGLSQDTLVSTIKNLHEIRVIVDEIEEVKSLELMDNLANDNSRW